MPVSAAILVLASASIVTFAAALVYALRGRRVDDHPICRRCGFDAFGKPAGSNACSECGADLTRRRATRIGRRERRRGLARVAGSGVFTSAIVLGGIGWMQFRGVDLQRHKPVWWLAREAGSRRPGMRDAALAELVWRVSLGKASNVTAEQLNPLITRAFAHQADASQPWVPGWGLLIEAAHDAGRLADDQWDRYRVQGFALRLKVREVVRRGDPIPIEFWADPPRLGTPPAIRPSGQIAGGLADLAPELVIGGQVISDARHGPGTLLLSGRPKPELLGSAIYEPPASVFAALADGPQTAQVSCLVTLTEYSSGSLGPQKRRPPVGQVLRASWRLVPPDTQTVGTATDEGCRKAVERSIRVAAADLDRSGVLTLSLLDGKSSPVPLAFDVYIRQGGREWPVGPATFDAGRYSGPYVSARCPGIAPGDAELVLRPSPAAAVRTAGVSEIWGGEIRIAPITLRRVGLASPETLGGGK